MPQLPNSSTDDYGADDEVKEYKQEDGEENENGTPLDLVNDIKSDLIKRETENSEEAPKQSSDASSAPIAQLLSFPDRYNEHLNSNTRSGYHQSADGMRKHPMHRGHGSSSGIFHPAHQGYAAGQYQYPVYPGVKPERYHYDPPMW